MTVLPGVMLKMVTRALSALRDRSDREIETGAYVSPGLDGWGFVLYAGGR